MATPPAPPSTVFATARTGARPKLAHIRALDGVRGVAILAVIASHTGYGQFGHGFYGVDVFFVLSGFLITTLLLEERAGTGDVSLRLFWLRRAARLLPALLAVCAVLLVVTGLNAIHSLRPVLNPYPAHTQLLGVAVGIGYVASWVEAIFHTNLNPIGHTWSLSVEEWFYVIWPLTLLALLRRRPRLVTRWVVALAVVALVYRTASETLISSRWYLYFAPDQRACQLLAGCALGAVVFAHGPRLAARARLVGGIGVAGAACVVVLMARPLHETGAHVPFEHFGLPLCAVAATAGIACLVLRPGFWLTRLFELRFLVWVGRRSYGLYLYHLPILLLVSPWSGPHGRVPWKTGAVSIVLMFAAAAASYRWLERPVIDRMRRYEDRVRGGATKPAPMPATVGIPVALGAE
jgi:peptidoglycan/LPS O-acetylase OafA/YrhL